MALNDMLKTRYTRQFVFGRHLLIHGNALREAVISCMLRDANDCWGNMKKVAITCRLDGEVIAFLDQLGEQLDRDRSYLIKDAVEQYVQLHRWQIEEVHKAIDEADAGRFATDQEVAATFDELTR
ncbi:MAG TPA: ribbon-helix-helix protein, CopG family [Pirellulales bacterium]|jgi:predicted transcriptional regulator